MNLYMNRFLVVIGGETPKDEIEASQKNSSKEDKKDGLPNPLETQEENADIENDDKKSKNSDSEVQTKSISDVWLFDIYL